MSVPQGLSQRGGDKTHLCPAVNEIPTQPAYLTWVWNLVAQNKGGTQAEGFREQSAEEDIWI